MISLARAWASQVLQGAKRAAVCSMPPSGVGFGIRASEVVGRLKSAFFDKSELGRSRKARYIWVVNRLGMFVGVIQRVKGIRESGVWGYHWFSRTSIRYTYIYKPTLRFYPVGKSKPSGMNLFSSPFSFCFRDL